MYILQKSKLGASLPLIVQLTPSSSIRATLKTKASVASEQSWLPRTPKDGTTSYDISLARHYRRTANLDSSKNHFSCLMRTDTRLTKSPAWPYLYRPPLTCILLFLKRLSPSLNLCTYHVEPHEQIIGSKTISESLVLLQSDTRYGQQTPPHCILIYWNYIYNYIRSKFTTFIIQDKKKKMQTFSYKNMKRIRRTTNRIPITFN